MKAELTVHDCSSCSQTIREPNFWDNVVVPIFSMLFRRSPLEKKWRYLKREEKKKKQ